MIVIVIATVLVVGAIAVGVAIGLQANTSTFDPQRTPANTEDCQQTCEVFQTRQSERCTADKIAADAEAYAKSLRELLQVVAVASIGAAGVIIAAALGAIAGLAAALGPVVVGLIVVGAILVGAVLALVLIATDRCSCYKICWELRKNRHLFQKTF